MAAMTKVRSGWLKASRARRCDLIWRAVEGLLARHLRRRLRLGDLWVGMLGRVRGGKEIVTLLLSLLLRLLRLHLCALLAGGEVHGQRVVVACIEDCGRSWALQRVERAVRICSGARGRDRVVRPALLEAVDWARR